jgi:hypoxanthine phosphoribosyltransferase
MCRQGGDDVAFHWWRFVRRSEFPMPELIHRDLERVLFTEAQILSRVGELAREIERDYKGKALTILALMNGSVHFVSDLMRRLNLPVHLECVSVSSYHGATTSSGVVSVNQSVLPPLKGRDVLLLDDILDSGATLEVLAARLRQEAASVSSCVLLRKKRARDHSIVPEYVGFEIEDEFVVGYGLDFKGYYRNLPMIGVLKREVITRGECGGE